MAKASMSVREMGQMLGLKKVESYWLIHKGYFTTIRVKGKMRVMVDSFEQWYRGQLHYKKVNGDVPGLDYGDTLSIGDFGRLLGLSKNTGYYLVERHKLKTTVILGRKRLMRKDVMEWLDSHPEYKEKADMERKRKCQKEENK